MPVNALRNLRLEVVTLTVIVPERQRRWAEGDGVRAWRVGGHVGIPSSCKRRPRRGRKTWGWECARTRALDEHVQQRLAKRTSDTTLSQIPHKANVPRRATPHARASSPASGRRADRACVVQQRHPHRTLSTAHVRGRGTPEYCQAWANLRLSAGLQSGAVDVSMRCWGDGEENRTPT